MNRLSGFSLVGAVAAFGAAAVFARPFGNEGEAEAVSEPEDLREELADVQLAAPPLEGEPLVWDGGEYLFNPGGGLSAVALAEGLVPVADGQGLCWPVTLFEDRDSRETVFLDALGNEIGRLPPVPGYDPGWIVDLLFPEGAPVGAAERYAPSRVILSVKLLPPPGSEVAPGAVGGVGRRVGAGQVVTSPAGVAGSNICSDVVSVFAGRSEAGTGSVKPEDTVSKPAEAVYHKPAKATNSLSTASATTRLFRSEGIVFVHKAAGRDFWNGRAALARGDADGPKRTVQAGLAVLRDGGILVVKGGAYSENLKVKGRKADVGFQDQIILTRPYENAAAAASAFSKPSAAAATGTVTRVKK